MDYRAHAGPRNYKVVLISIYTVEYSSCHFNCPDADTDRRMIL